MPVHVAKRKGMYCPVDANGKILSTGKCSTNRKKVIKQVQAVNISMMAQTKATSKKKIKSIK